MNPLRFLQHQVNQIKHGGLKVLFGKLTKLAVLILLLPSVAIVRLLRPWGVLRFGPLVSSRIGHFAGSTEIYLCERDMGINLPKRRCVDIFYYNESLICNAQLQRMWNRILHTIPLDISLLDRLNRFLPGGQEHIIPVPYHGRDVRGLMANTPPHLSFLPDEEQMGHNQLKDLGVPEGASFVCFYERDSAYLETIFPNKDWQYHDYRDASIHSYIPAVKALTQRQYYAIRMGAVVNEALPTHDPKIIDYATSSRSDFMDIFLCASCYFFLGNPAGLFMVAVIFRRPCAMVNLVPLEYVPAWGANDLFIPKKYWLRTERRFMTFREILESGTGRFLRSEQFEKNDIELIENTPEEITALAIEMDERLKGRWQTTEEDKELQRRFWSLFKPSELNRVFLSRIGAEFLRQNRELLD